MPERADTSEVIGLIMFAPLLYSMVPFRATRNPGVDQDLTDLAAAVQLRLRVALILAPRTRAAEYPPLKRKGQGASPCRSTNFRIRGEIMIILRFERRVCR